MTDEQMIKELQDLRDELVRRRTSPPPGAGPVHPEHGEMLVIRRMDGSTGNIAVRRTSAEMKAGNRQALVTFRSVLDDWIRGVRENHRPLNHPAEPAGQECWRSFTPADIRIMINDVARELGVDEFTTPETPEEDR